MGSDVPVGLAGVHNRVTQKPGGFRSQPAGDPGTSLAFPAGMPTSFRRSLPIAGVAVLMTGALALAQTHATPAPRIRPETEQAEALVRDLLARSPTARTLANAIQASDVIVYLRHRTFTETTLDGRIGFVHSRTPTRILIVEIGCGRSWMTQLVALGHELQHAVEIAAAPDVTGPAALASHFDRIGVRAGTLDAATFETRRAQEIGAQIRQEVLGNHARTSSNDRH